MHNIAQIFRGNVNYSATKTTDLSSPLPIGICTQGWGFAPRPLCSPAFEQFFSPVAAVVPERKRGRDFCVI